MNSLELGISLGASIIASVLSGFVLILLRTIFKKVDDTKKEAEAAKTIAVKEAFDQKISIEALVFAISECADDKKKIREVYTTRKEELRNTYEFIHN